MYGSNRNYQTKKCKRQEREVNKLKLTCKLYWNHSINPASSQFNMQLVQGTGGRGQEFSLKDLSESKQVSTGIIKKRSPHLLKNKISCQAVVVAHIFNSGMREAEAGGSL